MGLLDVEIEEGKDPKTYTYIERRAEILQAIIKAGHPKSLSHTTLAERYGVSNSQITHDMKAIAGELRKGVKKEAEFITNVFYAKATEKAGKATTLKELVEAQKIIDGWNKFLFDKGIQRRAPKELIVEDGPKRCSAADIYARIAAEKKPIKKKKKG